MSTPLIAALLFTVALLVTHGYFLFGSVPLLVLDHDAPMDGRFVRGFFTVYYFAALIIAAAAAASLLSAGRLTLGLAAVALAAVSAVARITIIPRMDALRVRIQNAEPNAIAAFRRMHVAAILLGLAQLVFIVWCLIAASMHAA